MLYLRCEDDTLAILCTGLPMYVCITTIIVGEWFNIFIIYITANKHNNIGAFCIIMLFISHKYFLKVFILVILIIRTHMASDSVIHTYD